MERIEHTNGKRNGKTNGKTTRAEEIFSNGEATLGKVTSRWLFVTPEIASEWLKKNRQNRKISKRRVDKHADQLQRGRFKVTGQTIAFDRNGVLIDGQHRLTAVVMSGIGFWFLVVEGLQPTARSATDLGVSRKPDHLLSIVGGEENPKLVSVIIKIIQRAVYGDVTATDWEDLDAHRKRYADGLAWARSLEKPTKYKLFRGPIMGALTFAYKRNPALVQKSYELLQSGVFDSKSDPLIALRDFAMQSSLSSSEVRDELFGKTLTALWHKEAGRKPGKLYATKEALEYFKAAYEK